MNKTKRLSSGHYLYRGFEIICVGYYPPEQRVCWEAVDKDGSGFAHGFSKKEVMFWIDKQLDEFENDRILDDIS